MGKQTAVFSGIGREGLKKLSETAETVSLEAGDEIIREADPVRAIFMLQDGVLQVKKNIPGGSEKVIMAVQPGEIIGLQSFISQRPSRVTVAAGEPSTVFRVDQKALNAFDGELARFFLHRFASGARDLLVKAEQRENELTALNKFLMESLFYQATHDLPGIESSVFIDEVISRVPRLPVFALSLAGRLLESDVSSKEIAREVKQDPSLAGMILKTINSSYHGMARQVSDLHDAVVLLGFNTVSQITIAEGMRRSLPDSPLFRRIHDHSLALSYISFEIAAHHGLIRPSEISTISILHDLGQIIIQLLKMKNPGVETLFDLIDGALIGAMLLEAWDLPPGISKTVKYQNYPWFAPPGRVPEPVRPQVATLYLSHLCYDYFKGKPAGELDNGFYRFYLKALKIKPVDIEQFVRTGVLSTLKKKMNYLPDTLVDILRDYSRRA